MAPTNWTVAYHLRRELSPRPGRDDRRRLRVRRAGRPCERQDEEAPAGELPGHDDVLVPHGSDRAHPGQNLNTLRSTQTCPNAAEGQRARSTRASSTPGSTAQGYITRFKPSMVEIKPSGKLVTPSVWDLHLHHVVWLAPDGGPTFASGEEKTIAKMPQGYGLKVAGDANWGLNYMIHNLNSLAGRQVYITWEIDWVPETTPRAPTSSRPRSSGWTSPARRTSTPSSTPSAPTTPTATASTSSPTRSPTDPSQPGYERARRTSAQRRSLDADQDRETLVFAAGHLHPGGMHVDLEVARDGPDAGTRRRRRPRARSSRCSTPTLTTTSRPARSAGTCAWRRRRRDWRISLKAGDNVSINVTYNVSKASWYESMGILPLAVQPRRRPAGEGSVRRRRRRSRRCTTRAASSPTAGSTRTSTRKARDEPEAPRSARLQATASPCRQVGHRDQRLPLLERAATRRSRASRRS